MLASVALWLVTLKMAMVVPLWVLAQALASLSVAQVWEEVARIFVRLPWDMVQLLTMIALVTMEEVGDRAPIACSVGVVHLAYRRALPFCGLAETPPLVSEGDRKEISLVASLVHAAFRSP